VGRFNSTSERTTSYIISCCKSYPTFQKNITFLKYLFAYKKLSDAYTGGINAYGLCLLYIAYLENKNLAQSTNHSSCLFGFLEFFTFEFMPEKTFVNLGPGM